MSTVNVLIVVDVEGALASNNLSNNLYMIDTEKFMGELEGTNELTTTVSNGETITWAVAPVDPSTNVTINAFTGQAIGSVVTPQANSLPAGTWSSQVFLPANSNGQTFQYSMNLQFDQGVILGFDPFLVSGAS